MYVRNFINVLFVTVLTWKLPQDPWTTMEKLDLPTHETLGMRQQLREIKQISFTNVLCREKPQCNLLTFNYDGDGREDRGSCWIQAATSSWACTLESPP